MCWCSCCYFCCVYFCFKGTTLLTYISTIYWKILRWYTTNTWIVQCVLAWRKARIRPVRCSPYALSSSSFYWASVANAPNVLQPYWLIVLPLDVPDLTASLLLCSPSGQRWRCLWTFLFSIVPTFATSRLQEILAAKSGTTWARNGRWILPENADFHVTFRDLLHVVNLRHGTDGRM